jgi:hypothetical protein
MKKKHFNCLVISKILPTFALEIITTHYKVNDSLEKDNCPNS